MFAVISCSQQIYRKREEIIDRIKSRALDFSDVKTFANKMQFISHKYPFKCQK